MKLFEKIRLARIRSGLTQEQLAQKIGVTRSAVAQWEYDNQTYPTKDNLDKLSFELGADLSYDDEPKQDRRYASLGDEEYVPLDQRTAASKPRAESEFAERNIAQQVDGVIRYLILEKDKDLFMAFKRKAAVDFETDNMICEVKTTQKAMNSTKLLQVLSKLASYAESLKKNSDEPGRHKTLLINVVKPDGMHSFDFLDMMAKTEHFRDIEIFTTCSPKAAAEKIIEVAKSSG